MSLPAQTFAKVTPEAIQKLAAKLNVDYGIQLIGNSGIAEHSGFSFSYLYDEASQQLVIQCLKKPIFIPSSVVMHGVAEHVAEAIS